MRMQIPLLAAAWDTCPNGVSMASTMRQGGVSGAPWHSLNLGLQVGDMAADVVENRRRLQSILPGSKAPHWLNQVHGTEVAHITQPNLNWQQTADAAYTRVEGLPLVILTADCLPVLIASEDGSEVGAAHAGWRSLCGGVLEHLVTHFSAPVSALRVWLGPAIGPQAYEVGPEVRSAFCQQHPQASTAFIASADDRYYADLVQLARQRLEALGILHIAGGRWCTWSNPEQFYSYRRDGKTGRMASLIWRRSPDQSRSC